MRTPLAALSLAVLCACKQGPPSTLEELPPLALCSTDGTAPQVVFRPVAQVGRIVDGTFQPLAAGAEVEVMPFSVDSWTATGAFVAVLAVRFVPPGSVTETTLCGDSGAGDEWSGFTFHRVGSYLQADAVLVRTLYPKTTSESLNVGFFFPLGNRTIEADAAALNVTWVNREGVFATP